jgi:uncharacterized YigZ family protein
MAVFSYLTIQAPSTGLFKEKGSKFLAFAFPVSDESQIKEHIAELKKKFFDARHHCFAWILDADKKRFRAFDDGEPNHSAGDPIIGQIRSRGLTNVLVVVVRYFGGTKLGVSGLIAAYKTAADEALKNAIVVECEVKKTLTIDYNYDNSAEVMRMVKEYDLEVISQDFHESCSMTVSVGLKNKTPLVERIELLKATGHAISLS